MLKSTLLTAVLLGSVVPAHAGSVPVIRATSTNTLLIIRDVSISVNSIEKYISNAGKVHIRYTFFSQGRPYQAIVYAGKWNSTTLARLRSGRASLIGTWSSYKGAPSFVTERVE